MLYQLPFVKLFSNSILNNISCQVKSIFFNKILLYSVYLAQYIPKYTLFEIMKN